MSINAYKVEAIGHDRTGKDFGYVNIMYRYGNNQPCPRPEQCEKMEVMWADESVYGPPAPGSKVGDFIQIWLMDSWNCGLFTHREIAQRLIDIFTGLKIKELEWFENPREKTLKNGKPRVRRAKWLPEREVDLVYLYSDHYLDARNPTPAETDFFTVTRMDSWGVSTWFMCTPQAAEKLIAMDYDNLAVQETTIVGQEESNMIGTDENRAVLHVEVIFWSGKRKVPPSLVSGKYCPHFVVTGTTEYLGVCFLDGDECAFDEPALGNAQPLYPDTMDYNSLENNAEFLIYEGANAVGKGRVLGRTIPYQVKQQRK